MKNIFSPNPDVDKTAILNWRTNKHEPIHNMIIMAEGFMEAAIDTTSSALANHEFNKKGDILVFPILFNANHSIELYLKAILWMLNILLDTDSRIEGKHNILQIYKTVCKRIDEFVQDKSKRRETHKKLEGVGCYISELGERLNLQDDSKRNQMDFSRYPFDVKYRPHFFVASFDNVSIDLENLKIRLSDIGNALGIIANHYLYEYIESD